MAYHEALWVTVGTAAPVIGLAEAVTLRRGSQAAARVEALRASTGLYPISRAFAYAQLYMAFASLAICIYTLFVSLWALATESDPAGPPLIAILVGTALILLSLQTACQTFIDSSAVNGEHEGGNDE